LVVVGGVFDVGVGVGVGCDGVCMAEALGAVAAWSGASGGLLLPRLCGSI
jgi:hypothetical protein